MSLRHATPSDLPLVEKIFHSSLGETGRNRFLCPNRNTYPTDYTLSISSQPRKKLLLEDPQISHNIIALSPTGEAVGWAFWRRNLSSLPRDPSKTPTALMSHTENKAEDPDRKKRLMDAIEKDQEKYFNVDHWYLSLLAVLPEHRRKGYGRMLVNYGMERAKEDGVVAFLTSSEDGEKLYRSLGWERVGVRSMPNMEGLDVEEVRRDCGEGSDVFEALPVMRWSPGGKS